MFLHAIVSRSRTHKCKNSFSFFQTSQCGRVTRQLMLRLMKRNCEKQIMYLCTVLYLPYVLPIAFHTYKRYLIFKNENCRWRSTPSPLSDYCIIPHMMIQCRSNLLCTKMVIFSLAFDWFFLSTRHWRGKPIKGFEKIVAYCKSFRDRITITSFVSVPIIWFRS